MGLEKVKYNFGNYFAILSKFLLQNYSDEPVNSFEANHLDHGYCIPSQIVVEASEGLNSHTDHLYAREGEKVNIESCLILKGHSKG